MWKDIQPELQILWSILKLWITHIRDMTLLTFKNIRWILQHLLKKSQWYLEWTSTVLHGSIITCKFQKSLNVHNKQMVFCRTFIPCHRSLTKSPIDFLSVFYPLKVGFLRLLLSPNSFGWTCWGRSSLLCILFTGAAGGVWMYCGESDVEDVSVSWRMIFRPRKPQK